MIITDHADEEAFDNSLVYEEMLYCQKRAVDISPEGEGCQTEIGRDVEAKK